MKTKSLAVLVVAGALLAACKGKSSKDYYELNRNVSAMDSAKMADSARVLANVTRFPTEKLIKTANINFKVKNVQKTEEDIASMTTQYKGMVMHHRVQSAEGAIRNVHISNDSIMRIAAFNTTGEMTIRIPSDNIEEFMTKVSHMGVYVNENKMDIDDASLDYLSNQLKLKDREDLLARQKVGTIRIKNPANVLALTDDMVDQKIQNMRTDAAVKFSIVNLNFYQSDAITKEVIANDDPSAYDIPFPKRLGLALANGWAIFVDLIVGLANLWVFLLCGLLVWRGVVYYKKRMKPAATPVS